MSPARSRRTSWTCPAYQRRAGLLRPASGYSFFEAVQLARLNRIIAMKNLGFTLDQVHAMLDEHVSRAAIGDHCRYVPAGEG
jgi:DNA-binding transcriptional MerR regulator